MEHMFYQEKGGKPSQRVHVQWALVLTAVATFGFRHQEGKSLVTAAVCTCVQGCVYRGGWGTPHHSAASLDWLRFHFHSPEGHLHVCLPSHV